MKLWSYRSRFAAGTQHSPQATLRRQVSPLLVARSVQLYEPRSPTISWPAWLMAGMVVCGIGLSLWIRWWFARGDRPLQQWRAAQAAGFQLPAIQPPNDAPDGS